MVKGYLSLVLHAHLPFIHHPESENYFEERWLFEAITETYIPLLQVFEGLVQDGADFRLTLSLSPPLLSMLANPLLQKRYLRYLSGLLQLAEKECGRTRNDEAFAPLARMYLERFHRIKEYFVETCRCNVISGFRKFMQSGHLEIVTCSATHAFLPYVHTEQALRSQIENAVRTHEACLGRSPRGIWLPECGFREGLDRILKDYGLDFFFTDTHGLLHARPRPVHGVYAPAVTPHGMAAFARDPETSRQVWSSREGYPGDYDYREYYRDIGFDLAEEALHPHLHPSGIRLNTGIKYYRITGDGPRKEPYNPGWAREKAAIHAGHFLYNRQKQAEHLYAQMDRKPLIVASYDAELFGHWWYEGPMWIDFLCRKIHYDQATIRMVTPAEYLCEYPENQECGLGFSSWGRGGAGVVWLGPSNQWIYRHLHRMEERMIGLADRFWHASGLTQRALNQAARELLLAQSSDWAFMMDGRTTVDYAVRRTRRHISRFYRIERDLLSGSLDRDWLAEVERRDAVFPRIDYRIHLSNPSLAALGARRAVQPADRLKVLVLSWEFPPMTVGGLSRHVFDLTRELVRQGAEVHVVTTHVDGYPAYERNQGIHVHRVRTFQAQQLSFMDWVFQLNLAMSDYAENLLAHYGPFDLIHAHDWLVCQAAVTLKQHSGLPLAATIHATEHGRNQGLWSDLHYAIHHKEWQLTYEAARVIVCSRYMEDEVKRLFALPEGKLDTIPNGVDARVLRSAGSRSGIREQFALPEERIVFFVGRLVREKGVHILLESIPAILSACPEAKFVIAGKGPMLEELQERARRLDVAHKVHFAGFIDDLTRNELFRLASVAVFPSLYEPFGIAALEAMAAGAPVIVSGTGGLQEIVEYGRDGFTVLPGDAASLANHVIRMLQEGQAAQDMALRALHKVMAEYHWESIAARTLNLYRSICSRKFSPVRNEIAAAGEGILSHPEYEEECK